MARRWWLAGALGVVLVALLAALAVVVADDDAEPGAGADVFVIGDSITVMAGGTALGPDGWEVDARSGRTTPEGIAVARELDLSGAETVVVALGTNDHLDDAATYGARIDAMLEAIGPGPEVVWVNVDAGTPELADAAGGVNAAIAAAVDRHPQLRLADWDAYVRSIGDVPGLRAGDGIHYGQEGSRLRAEWMVSLATA